ncbi:hypothetical protein llg_12680 [Luteolibacter sp. LG18]|nr:hypothetical protein llg_12680 [Luteolibacter sp. LG18]
MNDRVIHFSLPVEDFGQMLDGLIARQEAWAKTAAWHRGEVNDPWFQIEESKDEREAEWIAETYAGIIRALQEQARGQR